MNIGSLTGEDKQLAQDYAITHSRRGPNRLVPNLVFLVTIQERLITWIHMRERQNRAHSNPKKGNRRKPMKETEILILVLLSARMVGDFIFTSN